MKTVVTILCLFVAAAGASAIETADFRAASWGMTRERVAEIETLPVVDEGYDYLSYDHVLFDEMVTVVYDFENDVLAKAAYNFMPWPSSYTGLFNECRAALVEKYGEPTDEKQVYAGASFPSMTSREMEEAVTGGMLELIAEWETGRSTIRLWAGKSSDMFPPLVNLRYSRR